VKWLNLEFSCLSSNLLLIEEILFAHGLISIEYSDFGNNPIYDLQDGNINFWEKIKVVALFDSQADIKLIQKILEDLKVEDNKFSIRKNINWVKNYRKSLKPVKFGKNIWVNPLREKKRFQKGQISIEIEPGKAFGTGSHETTALCLEYLDRNKPINKVIVDYGCGSGILAIASIKLGAKHAYAIDIDPMAIDETKKNAIKNQVSDDITLIMDDLKCSSSLADLLIANILAKPLIMLRGKITRIVKPNGNLVLSGILNTQCQEIINEFSKDFDHQLILKKNNWCLLVFKKFRNL